MPSTTARQLRLPDGRHLGYAEFGDPRGRPVFFFHGFPGSRLEAELAATAATRLNLRIIAPDRPGIGLSDPHPGRTLADWPDDVRALADNLGLERFAVLGISGGGPYAIACAARLAGHLTAAATIGSLAPLDRPEETAGMSILNRLVLSLHLRIPTAGQMIYRAFAAAARLNPERVFTLMAAGMPPPDRAVLRGRTREILTASYREALRRGSRGSGRDLFLYCRPWDIDLETISVEVRLWHGEMDSIVPVAMGRRLAAAIPRCRAHFLPGEGHFSLPVRHLEEILAPLAAG